MKALALVLLAVFLSGTALAQERKAQPPAKQQEVRQRGQGEARPVEQRETRQERPQQQQRMTPQQREKLRQDINEANKNLRR